MAKIHLKTPKDRRKPNRPETVGFSDIVPAKRLRRIGSFMVDGALMFSMLMIGLVFLPGLPVMIALALIYMGVRDLARGTGRSLGRSMAGQRLLDESGEEITAGRAIGRNMVRVLLWMTILPAFIDLFMVLFGNGRLIADHIFDTRVYEDPGEVAQARVLQKQNSAHDEIDEMDEIEREALEDVQFESPDYNKRQLDDFEARLSTENTGYTASDDSDDEATMRDFEERLKAATNATESVEEERPEEVHISEN